MGMGRNSVGELGLNNTIRKSSPTQVGADTDWSYLAQGLASAHSLAIKTDGTLWSWGYNIFGQLGLAISNSINKSSPTQVGVGFTWLDVAVGSYATSAVRSDNTLWSWGNGNFGQLGNNSTTSTNSPVQVGALTNWAKISRGYNFAVAVKTDGTLWSWGQNTSGQLGFPGANKSSPVKVGSLEDWYSVASGNNSQYSIKTDGTLWSWGVIVTGV